MNFYDRDIDGYISGAPNPYHYVNSPWGKMTDGMIGGTIRDGKFIGLDKSELDKLTEQELRDLYDQNYNSFYSIIGDDEDLDEEQQWIKKQIDDETEYIEKRLDEIEREELNIINQENKKRAKEHYEGKLKEKIFEGLKEPYNEMKEKEEISKKHYEKNLISKFGKPFIESLETDKLMDLEYFKTEKPQNEIRSDFQKAKKKNNIDLPNGLSLEELTIKDNEWSKPLQNIVNDNSNITKLEDVVKQNIPKQYHDPKYRILVGNELKYPWEFTHIDLMGNKHLTDSKAYLYTHVWEGLNINQLNEAFNKYSYNLRKELKNTLDNTTDKKDKKRILNILSSKDDFEKEIIRRNDYPYIGITTGKITGENYGAYGSFPTMSSNIYTLNPITQKAYISGVRLNYIYVMDENTGKPKKININKDILKNKDMTLNYDLLTNDGRYVYQVLNDNNFNYDNNTKKAKLNYNLIRENNVLVYKVFPNKFIQTDIML